MIFKRKAKVSVPVLTYHSINIDENSYSGNDHIAFESDLRTIHGLGMKVISLSTLVDWFQGLKPDSNVDGGVALTLDDGTWFDYHSVMHPSCGMQTGMHQLLKSFGQEVPSQQSELHVSSFVITSPAARLELDQKNMVGLGWWGDDWWKPAQDEGLMSIECHSWDHNHPTLEMVAQKDNIKGDFRSIDNQDDCVIQVENAGAYIEKVTGYRPEFFAYPWGQASEYLLRKYMPGQISRHQFRAAFSIQPKHVSKRDNIWFLPRYVCGRDWKSPTELERILLMNRSDQASPRLTWNPI